MGISEDSRGVAPWASQRAAGVWPHGQLRGPQGCDSMGISEGIKGLAPWAS